ncbi:hypothetical protein N7452_004731 [Penicillium brevicompactum]|uniref:Arrestin C-terminal-like domain-containing protein n=1 Tax=Penicillium brevicompactum TaxID=5074 RepID=A0A9W9QN42_PENBR|nr:hypothetical protein N7452_004731 [Penicillium brevicompactum]
MPVEALTMFRKQIASSNLSLDQSCIFISEETAPCSVSGKFNLSLAHEASFKSIKVRLRGTMAIAIEGILGTDYREQVTFDHNQALASSKTNFRMPPGDHAFLFDIPLPCKLLETVTGPKHQYHTYRVDVVIERRLKSDLVISHPVRIYQISDFNTSYMRPSSPLTLEGHTDNGVQYCVSITDRNVPFGCTFPVECWFAPLSKDIKLNAVTIKVIEKQTVRLEATASESVRHNIHFITEAHSQTVFSESLDFAQGGDQNPDNDSDIEWRFMQPVCLPKRLDSCSQSISNKHIKISHDLVVTAQFGNGTEQKATQIKSVLPFKIYMTPNVTNDGASAHGQDIQQMQSNRTPPPAYIDHFSDLVVPDATDVDIFDHPMLTEISSPRSSSEQSTPVLAVPPAPLYEQAV